jgi:hypothetical protein
MRRARERGAERTPGAGWAQPRLTSSAVWAWLIGAQTRRVVAHCGGRALPARSVGSYPSPTILPPDAAGRSRAGSERVGRSEAAGERLEEAKHINRSLSALGDVMAALAGRGAGHVPFRNSKLTALLQDSLCGQAKAMMFVHVSPEARARAGPPALRAAVAAGAAHGAQPHIVCMPAASCRPSERSTAQT